MVLLKSLIHGISTFYKNSIKKFSENQIENNQLKKTIVNEGRKNHVRKEHSD
jgi:hypothetical protein